MILTAESYIKPKLLMAFVQTTQQPMKAAGIIAIKYTHNQVSQSNHLLTAYITIHMYSMT